jgi:hypothetical protein
MKLSTSLLIGTLTVCLCAAAQETLGRFPESEIALLRADIQTKKTDILQQNLALSDEQAKTFWPLQRSYENDLWKLGDQRLDVIRDYAKNWDNLTDETAKDLGERLLDYQKRRCGSPQQVLRPDVKTDIAHHSGKVLPSRDPVGKHCRSRDRVFSAANQVAQSPVDAAGSQS